MSALNFQATGEPVSENPDYDDTGCQCPPGDNQYLLEIDEGQVGLVHAACGKQPSYNWGDWEDLVFMGPIPVTVAWERECDGSAWHGDHRCDCGSFIQITAASTLTGQVSELASALQSVLSLFPPDLNPAGPAQRSRHAPTELINRLRALADQALENKEPTT